MKHERPTKETRSIELAPIDRLEETMRRLLKVSKSELDTKVNRRRPKTKKKRPH